VQAGTPTRLVGRVGEREVLERALRAVERDRSARLVEVVGEPGIGKTTLLGTIGLSEKTVESHLRSIFVKLDVRSRADVARALRPSL
jgi:ABC-type lipoprotein export system ATPase subunit